MDVLQWAIDPRGHSVPIHIAWFLIQVAFASAVAFLIVHAAYIRFFAGEKRWSGTTAPDVVATVPYFDTDIYDLRGLLRLAEKIWN